MKIRIEADAPTIALLSFKPEGETKEDVEKYLEVNLDEIGEFLFASKEVKVTVVEE